ncbi:MAG: alpha/beta hydrolase [Acidobacteria bacterium]|nr:alpha/beta hydrolase [Acidobacteriota bacterium]MXZ71625.1 alpha/beta hydrolase [Acidobacteriota bacterium]MYD69753.1 alpha/beta hydrolase [Acidobacteriota bacterium]MYJ03628.1 alpha/beta hydrolase [Acidobacteriota bacterium]
MVKPEPTRREFLRRAGVAGAAAALASRAPRAGVEAQGRSTTPTLRSVDTPVLTVGYEESGSPGGFPVVLLHGFPYDIRAWDGVAPPLAEAGYRVLAPYLRGYGTTRFRDPDAPRMAEQAAIAQDLVDFVDALGLERVATAGFDWGNRAACITSILHPGRVRAQVAIGGYSVQDTVSTSVPSPSALVEARLWYQWYFNTERGRAGLEANRHAICRHLWETWAPQWEYTDDVWERSAPSFDNPDFVEVVIHSYRHRHGYAPGEERFLDVERRLAERPPITVPAIVLRGADSGFGRPSEDPTGDQRRFTNLVARRIVEGAGHDLAPQRPDAVVDALLELLE